MRDPIGIRIPQDLRRDFFELRRLTSVLNSDTEAALKELHRSVGEFNATGSSREEAGFWCKVAIWSLLGEVDGISHLMRRAVLRNAQKYGLLIAPRERARLAEKRYNATSNSIIENKTALLSTTDSLKLAFRYFPKLFGAEHGLDTNSHGWQAFRRTVKVRNNLTHPKLLEHLSPVNGFAAIHPAIVWYLGEMATLFTDIATQIGAAVDRQAPLPEIPPFSEAATPWLTVFGDEDHRRVQELGERTLEYVKQMFTLLASDTTRAMGLCTNSFGSLKEFQDHQSQFAWRTYLRTLFTDVEGRISLATFQLEAATARGTVALSEEEVASLAAGEVEERLASALSLWAREFGNNHVAPRGGRNWEALRRARELRNRVTHPKRTEDLKITFNETDSILAAHDYLGDTAQALHLDEVKWLAKVRSIEEAIEEEHARSRRGSDEDEDS